APGLKISSLAICSTLDEARSHLAEHQTDLLFLDLNLRGESGFHAVDDFLAASFETIITTANTEHAVRAFEVGAVDYLVKPFSQQRLEQAIAKLAAGQKDKPISRILVKDHHGVLAIPLENIRLIRSAGDYTELHLIDGGRKLCAKSMDFLEHALPREFMRIHRTAIARVSMLRGIQVQAGGKYLARIEGESEPAPVGRTYYKKLREILDS
ncbi:MAG: LytTR family DNA-binding domain-containing protein, partial [Nitrospinota bacterium]|nr:LytTR family DNA-binding domain-containing protein [Nitrospinota bacterium]